MARVRGKDPVVESISKALQELFTAAMCHCMMHSGPEAALAMLYQLRDAIMEQAEDVKQVVLNLQNPTVSRETTQ